MRRPKRRSMRMEVIALSVFIVAIGGYVAYANIAASGMFAAAANVDAGADAACASSYQKFKSQAQSNPQKYGDPTQYADKMNSQVPCQGKGGSGHCNAKEGSQSPKDICGAEKDSKGEPLQPPKMPEKQPKQPDQNPCPATSTLATYRSSDQSSNGINALTGQPCRQSSSEQNAAANFTPAGLWEQLQQAFHNTFGGSTSTPYVSMSPKEEAKAVADAVDANPSIPTVDKAAYTESLQNYVVAARAVGNKQSVVDLVRENVGTGKFGDTTVPRTPDQIDAGSKDVTNDLAALAARAGGENSLVQSGNLNLQDTNILSSVGTVVSGWLNGVKHLFGF